MAFCVEKPVRTEPEDRHITGAERGQKCAEVVLSRQCRPKSFTQKRCRVANYGTRSEERASFKALRNF